MGRDPALDSRPGLGFRILLVLAATATLTLITIGAVVRVTGSGLGCPDWPLCHGGIIPPLEYHVLIEYSHRLTASLVSVLVLSTAVVAWIKYRKYRKVFIHANLALFFLVFEVALGGITVLLELPPHVVTLHLATAQMVFAMLLITLIFSSQPHTTVPSERGPLFLWAIASAAGTLTIILSGSYVVGAGASAACPNWPLCGDGLVPTGALPWTHMAHRLVAAVVGAVVLWTATLAWRWRDRFPAAGKVGLLAAGLLIAQILTGAANPIFHFRPEAQVLHLSLATALWGAAVSLVVLSRSPLTKVTATAKGMAPENTEGNPVALILNDYVTLTKPRIMSLLLLTALTGAIMAAGGIPSIKIILVLLLGGALASGGASALNHSLEEDIDRLMYRTRSRPVASHRVSRDRAMRFGLALNLLAFLLLGFGANFLSASLAMAGSAFYVLVYTRWLKRSTAQNIVIGGAAGAVPPLVGWATVTGGLALPAFYLFAIIFFWTPPHFWALSLMLHRDYAAAGIPMLPVVEGERWTRWAILLYILILNSITLLFFLVTQSLGLLYLVGAALLGGAFVLYAIQLLYRVERTFALHLYKYSLAYLALLFLIIMVDGSF